MFVTSFKIQTRSTYHHFLNIGSMLSTGMHNPPQIFSSLHINFHNSDQYIYRYFPFDLSRNSCMESTFGYTPKDLSLRIIELWHRRDYHWYRGLDLCGTDCPTNRGYVKGLPIRDVPTGAYP